MAAQESTTTFVLIVPNLSQVARAPIAEWELTGAHAAKRLVNYVVGLRAQPHDPAVAISRPPV